mmetsp:Transcript_25114/g.63689  ORF Transcript_25114/g.63689 Transcript_25114/m.63689 type:complete len:88 (-) Transcript_25114:268-531(-)
MQSGGSGHVATQLGVGVESCRRSSCNTPAAQHLEAAAASEQEPGSISQAVGTRAGPSTGLWEERGRGGRMAASVGTCGILGTLVVLV